ncbi:calcium-binding protein [Egbenema bharatensis]|uniref:calcium-binding protein n=1 Tax=Egbenema bharatensis TaxID=3463334 RepID=UPI003A8B74F7
MPKRKGQKDEEREERIAMEAIVDAYDPEEQAMGWYYYLQDKIGFPFQGKCILERKISPLKLKEVVDVIEMAPTDDCEQEMFVVIRWMERELAVPLVQIEGVDVDDETEEAIADWHYWMEQGYQLG